MLSDDTAGRVPVSAGHFECCTLQNPVQLCCDFELYVYSFTTSAYRLSTLKPSNFATCLYLFRLVRSVPDHLYSVSWISSGGHHTDQLSSAGV
jgi:hypothetical protein